MNHILSKCLKKIISLTLTSLIVGIFIGTIQLQSPAQALDLTWDFGVEDAICDGLEDNEVISCTEEETTSFTDFTGEYAAPSEEGYAEGLTTTSSAREFVVSVTNFILSFLGLAAIVVVIYGGVLYVTAGGESEKADKGKKSIMYAMMGIIIVLISYALVNTLIKGATGQEDEGSGGGLYSSNGISSESLSEFQSADMMDDIKELTQLYLDQYSEFVNTASILDAMAKVGYFNDDGLKEMEEGLNLILDQVDPFSDTADEVSKGLDIIERYVSMNVGESLKTLVSKNEWMEANVMLAEGITDEDPEETAVCIEKCGMEDLECIVTNCGGEEVAIDASDPYGVGVDFVTQMQTISETSLTEFMANMADIVTRLEEMQAGFTDLTTINILFTEVIDSEHLGGYNLALSSGGYTPEDYTFTYLNDGSTDLTLYTMAPGGSGRVGDIVNVLNQLYTDIKDLQFTTAVITANTDEGNAPLTVTFDGLKSYDPTDLSLFDPNYEWDLEGDGFDDLDEETETGATVTKTYEEPGTYRVGLLVKSNEPETIASGVSYLSVTVNSPSSIIRLTATTSMQSSGVTLENPDDGMDLDEWTITQEEAQGGVTFDASQTTDGSGNSNTIINYSFNFGDGEYQNGENPIATHVYTTEGSYNFILEVTDQNGVKDRSLVTIKVSSPAAHMLIFDTSLNVGDEMIADGGSSLSDNGPISLWSWSIIRDGTVIYFQDESGTDELQQALTVPGIHTVSLTVSDSTGKSDTISQEVIVESTPPEAVFGYSIPNPQLPNRVYFDAGATTDPDPGDTKQLTYEWTINGEESTDYDFAEDTDATSIRPVIDFYKTGDFNVTLTARDPYEGNFQKSDTYQKTVTITSLLSIQVENTGISAVPVLQTTTDATTGITTTFAEASLNLISNYGVSYEIDWADESDPEVVEATTGGTKSVSHTYATAGIFPVNVTVYDAEGNSNSATHNIYIGNGISPVAIISVSTDSYFGVGDSEITGDRTTVFKFDASNSVGKTGKPLPSTGTFNWNFGDGTTETGKIFTHQYKEIGTYEVTLTVYPQGESAGASTTLSVTIESKSPEIYTLTAEPEADELVTPLSVKVQAHAEDADGKIVQYKFWYYDVNNSSELLGTQVSSSDTTYLTINTNGETGMSVTYGFGVEVVDDENNKVISSDVLSETQIPTLDVENGPNQAPTVEVNVDQTNILINESVTFSAEATDEDGEIDEYVWDFEGDGFYNNEPGSATMTQTFESAKPDGIEVRVKVTDDGGATAISDPIKIYVDTLTQDPTAAFIYTIKNFDVTFVNNSSADTENGAELSSYVWDFDTQVDTDGDGVKDNDSNSTEMSPVYTYPAYDTYTVKLTITDNEGNFDKISQDIKLVETDPPQAAFTYEPNGLEVTFTNTSKVEAEDVTIVSYVWDFNTNVDDKEGGIEADLDGNGIKNDDVNSTEESPTYTYLDYKSYDVKLTVIDSLGRTDTVSQTVKLEKTIEDLVAYLTSSPEASHSDNKIHLTGESGTVTFTFSAKGGEGDLTYWIDKNVYYNSDGDQYKDNDHDYEAFDTGNFTTDFSKSWGSIVVKLTVEDEQGNTNSVTREIKFDSEPAATTTTGGQTSVLPVTTSEALYILLTALGFTLLGARLYTQTRTK